MVSSILLKDAILNLDLLDQVNPSAATEATASTAPTPPPPTTTAPSTTVLRPNYYAESKLMNALCAREMHELYCKETASEVCLSSLTLCTLSVQKLAQLLWSFNEIDTFKVNLMWQLYE